MKHRRRSSKAPGPRGRLARRSAAIALGLCLSTPAPSRLWAQPVDAKAAAAAEALYREGRAKMTAGNLDAACPKLEASLKLERAIGTLWHLARCYEETGRGASAWALFLEVAREARRLGRPRQEKAASRKAEELEPTLCQLVLQVDATGMTPVTTRVDGRALNSGAWGTPVPVDCGSHELEVTRGGATETVTIEVDRPGEATVIEAPMPVEEIDTGDDQAKRDGPEPRPEGPAWYGDVMGWGLLGGGLAAGGASLYLYLRAGNLEDDAREPGLDLAVRDQRFDDADTSMLLSLVAAGAGAALVVAGAVKLGLHDGTGAAITPTDGGAAASLWFRF